jgi:hypothetical protein
MIRSLAVFCLLLGACLFCCFIPSRVSDPDKLIPILISALALALGIWNWLNQSLARPAIEVLSIRPTIVCETVGTNGHPVEVVFFNRGNRVGIVRLVGCLAITDNAPGRPRHRKFRKLFRPPANATPCGCHPSNEWIEIEPYRINRLRTTFTCSEKWAAVVLRIEQAGGWKFKNIAYFNNSRSRNHGRP